MHDKIQDAFNNIYATDQMKTAVSNYLSENAYKNPRKTVVLSIRPLLSACALLLICLRLGSWYFLEMPISYVSVDVNPSIELTLNRINCVTKAEGKNKDGRLLLEHIQIIGKDYLTAVELLVESNDMQQYLTENADLTFTVASSKAEELLSALNNSAVADHYQSICQRADLESVKSAHECGLSIGKYQMYQLLAQYDDSFTAQDCHHMSMCQLHDLLLDYENGNDGSLNHAESHETEKSCGHHGKHCH